MSYESPIDVITTQFIQQLEDRTFRAVLECGVHVDKDQLIKALAHDRGQYEKGYEDGVNSVKDWIPLTQKRPAREGAYIVTIINNVGDYITTTAYYSGVEGYEWDGKKVTAWAELPEPYKGEECPGE